MRVNARGRESVLVAEITNVCPGVSVIIRCVRPVRDELTLAHAISLTYRLNG